MLKVQKLSSKTQPILAKKLLLVFLLGLPIQVTAQGFFDDLDPCIAAKDSFHEGRTKMRSVIQARFNDAEDATAPEDYRDAWWEEKRKQLREYFDESELAGIIQGSGGSLDKGFVLWLANQIEAAGGIDEIDKLIDEDFRKMTKLELSKQQAATEAQFEQQKNKLYSECKPDVLNQALRSTLTMAMAPGDIISGIWEGAKGESGELAKIVRATTGISWRDIEKYGLCGGPNSEFRNLFGSLC